MQKGSALITVVLISLLVFGVGLYFYFDKSNPQVSVSPAAGKAEQETYTGSQLAIKFEYGKDLSVKEDSEEEFNKRGNGDFRKNFKGYVGYEPGKFVGAVLVLDKQASYDTNPFTVRIFENPDNLTIDQWYEKFWYYPFVWGDFTDRNKKASPQNIATISGQAANYGVVDYQPGKPKFVYLSKDKKMYLFRIIGETGNKILSTVNFLQ